MKLTTLFITAIVVGIGLRWVGDIHKDEARRYFIEHGYDTSGMRYQWASLCSRGESAYVIDTENGSRVRVCIGGLLPPRHTIIPEK